MTWPPLVEVAVVVIAQGLVAWAATYLSHSTVAVGLAWVVDHRRELTGLDRARVWRAALVMPLLTASLGTLGWPSAPVAQFAVNDALGAGLGPAGGALVVLATGLVLALVGVVMLVRSRREVARAFGRRRNVEDASRVPLDDLTRRAGWSGAVLTTSSHAVVPAAIGPREICVPATFFHSIPVAEQRAILAHELGHLIRRDGPWNRVAAIVTRTLIFQPLNRLALRRLRESAEEAADDFAVRLTGDPVALARALTALASVVLVAGGVAANGSPVVRRVTRLVSSEGPRGSVPRAVRFTAAGLVAMCLVGVAPAARWDPDGAANRLPWLAPSHDQPNARMLEVRQFVRGLRDALR